MKKLYLTEKVQIIVALFGGKKGEIELGWIQESWLAERRLKVDWISSIALEETLDDVIDKWPRKRKDIIIYIII